jgi:hypothetical protein
LKRRLVEQEGTFHLAVPVGEGWFTVWSSIRLMTALIRQTGKSLPSDASMIAATKGRARHKLNADDNWRRAHTDVNRQPSPTLGMPPRSVASAVRISATLISHRGHWMEI